MRSLVCLLLVGCVPAPLPPPPPIAAVSYVAPPVQRGPTVLRLEPFTDVELQRDPTAFTAGTIETLHALTKVGTIDNAVFERPRRVVVGTANHWWLVDPVENRVIAEVGRPDSRLSEHELVVDVGSREAVVDLRDGSMLRPSPKLPIDAPIESMHVIHANEQDGSSWFDIERAEVGTDVFLTAVAGGRRFIGPWDDRSPTPTLADEIESPPSGWRTTRHAGALEMRFGVPQRCLGFRLAGTPECLTEKSTTHNTGSWEVSLSGRTLLARDTLTGRDELVNLPCDDATIEGRSVDDPRLIARCGDRLIAWTPGHARELVTTDETPHYTLIDRIVSLSPFRDDHEPIGNRWLDLERGTVLHGPLVTNLQPHAGRIAAFANGRGMIIDGDKQTVHDVGALPCRGEIMLGEVKGDFLAFSCGIRTRPHTFDFVHVWSKVVDTRTSKLYDLPGYPAALFADGTVILSNRTRLTAETRGPLAKLTVARLR